MKWWVKLLASLSVWIAYALAYLFFEAELVPHLNDLILLPVMVTAWFWGRGLGLTIGVLALGLTPTALETLPSLRAVRQAFTNVPGLLLHSLLGVSFGHFGYIQRQLTTQKQLTQRAQYDELTGLLTRATFEQQFKKAIEEARETGARLALLFIDLDRFKFVNDTYGHEVGDELLKEVAACLKKSVRQDDLAARLGGDEFILALRGLKETRSAATVASELVKLLGSPFEIQGKVLNVSASVGISIFPGDGEDVETLTRNADTAMYQTKAAGKNAYTFSTKQVQDLQTRRLRLEHSLRLALGDNQLKIHYQPQVDMQSGKLIGFEVLLRWQHPDLGEIKPSELIPLAEEAGLIIPIGHWLLREACLQAMSWQRSGFAPVQIAVNVSALQFAQKDFVAIVAKALQDSGLAPEYLEIEITESLLMKDLSVAAKTLQKLRRLGVETVLDDFGTGHSSLSYLQQLPIQSLKIDRSFISLPGNTLLNESNQVIVEAICALAHKLGKTIIAEGIETEAQYDYLRDLGCDYAQGFLFSKPLTNMQAEQFLLEEALREEARQAKAQEIKAREIKAKELEAAQREKQTAPPELQQELEPDVFEHIVFEK